MSIPKLQVLDDERIQELDHDLAEQYFEVHNIPKPEFAKQAERRKAKQMVDFDEFVTNDPSQPTESILKAKEKEVEKKAVKFADIDDDHEGDWQTNEIQKLTAKVQELTKENADLKRKLDEKGYTETYKENLRLEM